MKIRKGDTVVVITGIDKGKQGKVLEVFPRESRVLIEGVNMKKKHQKPQRANQKGQIIETIRPLHVSNVALIDPNSGKPTRVGFRNEGGKKVRVLKKSGTVLTT
jgi:large subunit ribosomal protein L24